MHYKLQKMLNITVDALTNMNTIRNTYFLLPVGGAMALTPNWHAYFFKTLLLLLLLHVKFGTDLTMAIHGKSTPHLKASDASLKISNFCVKSKMADFLFKNPLKHVFYDKRKSHRIP